jgi:hypothetical protein
MTVSASFLSACAHLLRYLLLRTLYRHHRAKGWAPKGGWSGMACERTPIATLLQARDKYLSTERTEPSGFL